jgi:hypothetical protein
MPDDREKAATLPGHIDHPTIKHLNSVIGAVLLFGFKRANGWSATVVLWQTFFLGPTP